MESLGQIFSGGIPNVGPGGTPPILPSPGGSGGLGVGNGDWMSKLLPGILAGSGIFGTIGNIQANQARNAVLQAEMKRMNAYNNMTPADVTKGITSLEQPLSSNLINNVTNATQGQLASRGLSQAPGIFAQSISQGLAPYQLQEQQIATDAFFKKLGLPISAQPSPFGPFPATTNTNQLWQALMMRFMGNGSGGNQVPGSAPGSENITSNLVQQMLLGQGTPGLTPSTSGDSGTGGGVD